MSYSYWERQYISATAGYTIVGAGLVGCSIALALRNRYPQATIQIIDAGASPQGASTKNAGFVCTGSASELLDNMNDIGSDRLWNLVERRWRGRTRLLEFMNHHTVPYRMVKGYEAFNSDLILSYNNCLENLSELNRGMSNISGVESYFTLLSERREPFRANVNLIQHNSEGQIQPALLLQKMQQVLSKSKVRFINGISVHNYESSSQGWKVLCNEDIQLNTRKLILATNALSADLIPKTYLRPVRNQVIVSQKIEHSLVGCVHMDKGYFYLRNVGNRILVGGGRHILGDDEMTRDFGNTDAAAKLLIQTASQLLDLPEIKPDFHWSGILGMAMTPEPIAKSLGDGLFAAVGLGGMGVAISMQLGHEIADLTE